MTPNPSYFLNFSPARKLLLGISPATFCATPTRCEPLKPQTRGEALDVSEGAFPTILSA